MTVEDAKRLDLDGVTSATESAMVPDALPAVFVFNPLAEGRIAFGRAFTPTRAQTQLAGDLACLPQFLCQSGDVVLVPERPSSAFLDGLKQAGFATPEFVELGQEGGALARREFSALRPWAWAPDSLELLAPLMPRVTPPRPAEANFNDRIAALYSKTWSADFLKTFLAQRRPEAWLCGPDDVGVTAQTLDTALDAVAAIRRHGHERVVLKQSLGVAGQNALRLWEKEISDTQRQWMRRAMEEGHSLVVEPWHEREIDCSAQLEMNPQGLTVCGYTGLLNDRRGQFQANWAEPRHREQWPAQLAAALALHDGAEGVSNLFVEVFACLERALGATGFCGPLGIDAFVYRAADGVRRLKPVVEINPRFTMGRLTVELMRHAAPGARGTFRLLSRNGVRTAGAQDLRDYAAKLEKRAPLQLEGHPPRLLQGALCLNDPATAQGWLAVFQVE